MIQPAVTPPRFPLPNPKFHFFASQDGLYEYGNLYGFAGWLKTALEPFTVNAEHPILLMEPSSDRLVFSVAACWLLKLPFICLSPSMTDGELQSVFKKINPGVVIASRANRKRLGHLPALTISGKKLGLKKSTGLSLFTSSEPELLLGYFLTSGSTGSPKIVPLNRRQVLFAARASAENFKPEPDHYWLLCMPLNHTGGIMIILRCILYQAAIYRMDRFDEQQIITFLSENRRFQVASMVPTMLKRLLQISKFRVHPEFQAILLGGGPVTPALIRHSAERVVPVVASYGMTETCGQIAANPFLKPSGTYYPKKSVGRIFKPNSAQIRDASGRSVPPNEPGIIWLNGPQVFDGYYDEKHNRGKFDDEGWFKTGDYGYLNRDKQLFVQTRRSDLILTGGENVNPLEVESALEALDLVLEAAVTGVTDAEWGQAVIAFVIPTSGDEQWDEESVRASLRERLSPFKIPKQIIPLKEFPRSRTGKVHKIRLAERYEKNLAQSR